MESSFTLRVSELDSDFVKTIKRLFSKEREVTITISSATDFGLHAIETKEEYFSRLEKALKNIEQGKGIVISEHDFDKTVAGLLQK